MTVAEVGPVRQAGKIAFRRWLRFLSYYTLNRLPASLA